MVASVASIGAIPTSTRAPFKAPARPPTSTARAQARAIGQPSRDNDRPSTTPQRPNVAPTDRSIPPETINAAMPHARTPISAPGRHNVGRAEGVGNRAKASPSDATSRTTGTSPATTRRARGAITARPSGTVDRRGGRRAVTGPSPGRDDAGSPPRAPARSGGG